MQFVYYKFSDLIEYFKLTMGRQIIIGKEGNQPFQIPDPKVSRRHAILNVDDNGTLHLIDNSSTNGTYIYNGTTFVRLYANQPYPVQPDSMIQLGPDTRFHVRRLLSGAINSGMNPQPGGRPQPPKPKRKVNIAHLRQVAEDYETNKLQIESKSGSINGLRSLAIIISMAAAGAGSLFISGEESNPDAKLISTIISFAVALLLMVGLLVYINSYNKKLMQRRRDNEHDYAVKYVCPECKVSFRGKIYDNILAERCCPRCKTEYYEGPQA